MASNFKKMFQPLVDLFRSGGNGPVITATGTLPGGTAILPPEHARARASYQQHSAGPDSRVALSQNKMKMYHNQYKGLVLEKLQEAFHPDNYSRIRFVVHTSTNILGRIVDELSVLYESPSKRSLVQKGAIQSTEGGESQGSISDRARRVGEVEEGDSESGQGPTLLDTGDPDIDSLADLFEIDGHRNTEGEETPFDRAMKASDWDVLLDTVEKMVRFLPCVWVRPVVTYSKMTEDGRGEPESGKLSYVVYTPDVADVVVDPSNPAIAIAFWYWGEEVHEGQIRKVVHFYNSTNYWKLDDQWRPLHQQENPLGRLPVAVFRKDSPTNSYYLDGVGDDLYEATLELCILKTIQNARAKDSAFKQLAIQGGSEKDTPSDQVMGGPSPIFLGDEQTATVLDMQPALDQFTDLCEKRELFYASKYGISAAEYKSEGTPQSGFAKKLDRDKILKENRRIRKHFAKAEQDLYHLLAATLDKYPVDIIGKLPLDAELLVDFAEPVFEEDPQTQARTDALALKMNTTSILAIMQRDNPDMTEYELAKLAAKNRRINEAFMSSQQASLVSLLAGEKAETSNPQDPPEEE